ncbi:hypothetical protein [Vagococcus sp.]|uniref:hypothetical protein n=1 Tax=Vagococcus sp. TaxID=1933889 RepID=UPI003F98F04A
MSKVMITIGSVIDYPTIHHDKIVGQVELILENTVIVRDFEDGTHLVLKRLLQEDGFSVDERTYRHKTQYSKG